MFAALHPVNIHAQGFQQGKDRIAAESASTAKDDDLVVGSHIFLE